MKKLLAGIMITLTALSEPVSPGGAADKEKVKAKKVPFEVYDGYFESNKSGLKGAQSFLAFTDAKAFNKTFGKAVVMGKKRKFLPDDAFDSKLVVATIKRGGKIWTYKVEKVGAGLDDAKGKLFVLYKATSKDGGKARFASPLIIAVDKGKYTSVVFIENGKRAGTARIEK
jgi:hypothetical protein